MQHWIEFLSQARALLATIILTARAVLVIRALRPNVPTSTTKSDAATPPTPTPSASTSDAAKCSTLSTPPDRFSHTVLVILRFTQITAAVLTLIDWMN
jgi:hypothetical protein